MRITTKGRYALRAVTNLALSGTEKPKSIKAIAGEENISPEFLEQIFFKLKKTGILDSVRGPGGGFTLNVDPSSISVKDIFLAVDEGLDLTPCTTCNDKGEVECTRLDVCLVHDVWKEASEHINKYFEKITLRSIMENPKSKSLLSAETIQLNV